MRTDTKPRPNHAAFRLAASERIAELNRYVSAEDGEKPMTKKASAYMEQIALKLADNEELHARAGYPVIGIEDNGGANLIYHRHGKWLSIVIHPDVKTFDLYSIDGDAETVHERLHTFNIFRIMEVHERLFAAPRVLIIDEESEENCWDQWAANRNVIPFPARHQASLALAA